MRGIYLINALVGCQKIPLRICYAAQEMYMKCFVIELNQLCSEGHEILVRKEPCLLVEQMLHGRRKIIKYIH